MKIALFSDIHSNLPALETCLASIDAQHVDMVYCLGDLVGYNVWPNEVIHEIRKRKIPTISGNYDFGIGQKSDDCGCAYKTDLEKEMGKVSIAMTNQLISSAERNYLRTLPSHIRLEFKHGSATIQMLLVHGSPRKINEYLFEDREEKSMVRIMEQASADILCFGHTHKPYHRIIQSGTVEMPHYRHAVNLGSVGKPKDGDPRGCYAILQLDENTSNLDPKSLTVDFIRFEYDVEKAAVAVENSELPDAYADMLRKGY